MWIHAGNGESDARSGADDAVHFLLVIDAASAGRFEAEFFVRGQTIDFALYCPPGQERAYQPLVQAFPAMLARTPYRAGHTHVGTLRQTRSLMDVFKSLPYTGLGLSGIDVSSQAAAGNSIQTIKDAINKVSTNRANLGSLQNRLEYTINNLDTTVENMSAANSRIRDTDMAKEMMNYTKMNILTQSAQAMLAQANQQPQAILQLLQ